MRRRSSHFGRRVKSAGFMIYFGSPAFFVEASDSLMLDRRQRMLQSFGGPFAELVLAGFADVGAGALPRRELRRLLYKFALINYFVIFLNLIPLLELDGYWILSDLIQVPDLRPRSLEFLQHDLWHKLRTRDRFTKQEIGLGLYAVIGIVFTIFSFYTAYFFWQEIFGGLVSSLVERRLRLSRPAPAAGGVPGGAPRSAAWCSWSARSSAGCAASCAASCSAPSRSGGSRPPS